MNVTLAPWRMMAGLTLVATTLTAAPFEPLFRLASPSGPCQVLKPGATAYEPALKGKAYPFGTAVRTGPAASVAILLSQQEDFIQLGADTQITLASDASDAASKVLRIDRGSVITSMGSGNAENALIVETPVARCQALVGRGEFQLSADAIAFSLAAVSSAGGSMKIVGPQFAVPVLKAGYSMRIVTARDESLTRLVNTVGDYTVHIDKGGGDEPLAIETSTHSTVRIWRERAPVGGRLIVSVLVTGSDGKGRECFAFAVGQPDVSSTMTLQVEDDTSATNAPADVVGAPEAAPAAPPAEGETVAPATPVDNLFQ